MPSFNDRFNEQCANNTIIPPSSSSPKILDIRLENNLRWIRIFIFKENAERRENKDIFMKKFRTIRYVSYNNLVKFTLLPLLPPPLLPPETIKTTSMKNSAIVKELKIRIYKITSSSSSSTASAASVLSSSASGSSSIGSSS
jgi:hypothetical protein